ncbi:MAG: hypothetical protein RBS82_06575, partial [Syntrophales bacterium]|nr:hypothetical protein [Syntrophales bacterium]
MRIVRSGVVLSGFIDLLSARAKKIYSSKNFPIMRARPQGGENGLRGKRMKREEIINKISEIFDMI